ncbi:SPFH domain-containing protein [Haloferula chungangensis]|uniref:SPFH domain-containing protein n=1 Tax=Haloferula chungangensis TaxID=1048331 RepID=A0ABW2L621_9BACT
MTGPQSLSLFAIFLWLESLVLAIGALVSSDAALLPASALMVVLGSLHAARPLIGLVFGSIAAGLFLTGVIPFSSSVDAPVTHAVAALILGVACAFTGILFNLQSEEQNPARKSLVQFAVFLHFPIAGLFMADPFTTLSTHRIAAWVMLGLFVLVTADTLSKVVSRLYTPKRHWHHLPDYGAFFFYRFLGPRFDALSPPPAPSQESLKLAEMWMWPSVRRALPALAISALLLSWLGTAVHEVSSSQLGIRQTLGSLSQRELAPGLHFAAPYPFGTLHRVESARIRQLVLGFKTDPGKPILWERAHYEEEEISLVGGGDDYLSISVPISYRIARPCDFLRSTVEAESLLESLSARILQRLTASLPASEIMTTAREALRSKIKLQLQHDLDALHSGILIETVHLRDIHPPVNVAPFFQDVVSAIEDKETAIHSGEEYRNDNLLRYAGNAKAIVISAESSRDNRILAARGDTDRFQTRARARAQSPSLYDLREGFAVYDTTLGGAKKAIFDDRIQGDMPMHLDLRKVLNPDLIDRVPPVPQSLIARPGRSREAFDLEIEGYLRADRGEIPAPDFSPADPDNTLESETPEP